MAGKTIGELTTLENPSSSAVIPISADGSTLQKTTFGDVANKYITNCITEIPQDIKLEINNGSLVLKEGSKIYVPNGIDTFDTIITSSDLTLGPIGSYTGTSLLYLKSSGDELIQQVDSYSGTTAPSGSGAWYDTTENLIKVYTNGSDTGTRLSFPLALVYRNTGSWDAINKVFNGFGYIGSVVFALPGVKGLIPNGRDSNGTVKNLEYTLNMCKVSYTLTGTNHYVIHFGDTLNRSKGIVYQEVPPTLVMTLWYKPSENKMYRVDSNGVVSAFNTFVVGFAETISDAITSFTTNLVFTSVDANKPHIIETYHNGTSWYRVWSNGWCEQGGYNSNAGHTGAYTATVTLIKPMKDTTYFISRTPDKGGISNAPGTQWITGVNANTRTTTSFQMFTDQVGYVVGDFWEVKGYCW